MTRRLVLLRHAKSSWDDPSLPDEQRPLAQRGRDAVALLRQHLATAELGIDLVLCSPARRTRETWDGVSAGLRPGPDVRFVADVYEATAQRLLEILHQVEAGYHGVLLIGHNPGMAELADRLIGDGKHKALARLGRGFKTGALATLSFDAPWSELGWGGARLDSYLRPGDLAADQ